MRVQPHEIGSYMHVMKRGARGMEIARDTGDQWRFIKSLYYLNTSHPRQERWEKSLSTENVPLFTWPKSWPPQDKLVEIAAYILMPNHFHLILKEIREDGISVYMQRLCGSMTLSFNEKYHERGSLFQGAYKAKLLNSDEYLKQTTAYVLVKNSFELMPGGLLKASENFENAWERSLNYEFSSLADYGGTRSSSLIDKGLVSSFFPTASAFKKFAKDAMLGRSIDPELDLEME